MNDNLATSFRRSIDLFREQARGRFADGLISDVLEPMAQELEALSAEIESTVAELAAIESEIGESNS